ncbi:UNKNOWN [Stylonychia lemnae]|uniref:Uncharacterized protein n=1 Tax=Stylonychia lemnae TaxID=5949 RepID=A0A078AL75_STYLE|nr:UNKNOWN [Stylonychia lemnae]|eukprot:CDW82167.1 UNKNOWN [Stylonychia lemnae]
MNDFEGTQSKEGLRQQLSNERNHLKIDINNGTNQGQKLDSRSSKRIDSQQDQEGDQNRTQKHQGDSVLNYQINAEEVTDQLPSPNIPNLIVSKFSELEDYNSKQNQAKLTFEIDKDNLRSQTQKEDNLGVLIAANKNELQNSGLLQPDAYSEISPKNKQQKRK